MFCNLFWNPDCPLFSPLSGEPLKFCILLQCSVLPLAELKEEHQEGFIAPE